MFTFTKTVTTDLRQAVTPTRDSTEVNIRLKLKWRHAYGRKYYAVVNRFLFGSSSYDSVMHTAPNGSATAQTIHVYSVQVGDENYTRWLQNHYTL